MSEGLKEHAIPGDITGTEAKNFNELYPEIKSPAPFLRCKFTGVLYPNTPTFAERSDILEPHWPTAPVVAPTAEPVTPVPADVAVTTSAVEPATAAADSVPADDL